MLEGSALGEFPVAQFDQLHPALPSLLRIGSLVGHEEKVVGGIIAEGLFIPVGLGPGPAVFCADVDAGGQGSVGGIAYIEPRDCDLAVFHSDGKEGVFPVGLQVGGKAGDLQLAHHAGRERPREVDHKERVDAQEGHYVEEVP